MITYQVFKPNNQLLSEHISSADAIKAALVYEHENGAFAHVEQVRRQAIGAWAEIEYLPEGDTISAYFSFGSYDEENEADSYGVRDDKIFYYCDMDEYELQQLMNATSDFRVLSYELE
mgnify:CR=1 FL=1